MIVAGDQRILLVHCTLTLKRVPLGSAFMGVTRVSRADIMGVDQAAEAKGNDGV